MPSIRRLSAIQIPQEESKGADYHHQSPDKNLTHTLHPVAMTGFLLVIRIHTHMGESRVLNTPQIGDVDMINFDEGVFTGRKLLLRMKITSD